MVAYNAGLMAGPRVIPREQHPISRRDIDPDALKVLYRLRQFNHTAYLVGGSVRDLLLGRRPKDFDIGTSAHPYQVKKLFRNCWIIGRRFRLAHVKFGQKIIEVATFRRQVAPGEEVVQDGVPAPVHHAHAERGAGVHAEQDRGRGAPGVNDEHLIHRDNTFGTPEEDAFRRDFTINALFYDIATFSIIDYVSGLDDLRDRVVRSIGDPDLRLREDPVRMLRAIALAARLDFTIEPMLLQAIRTHRQEIAKSSPARMMEEYYKILRAGSSERAFRGLGDVGLLEPTAPELHRRAGDALWRSLAELDAYRRRFESMPDTLTNPILLGTLLVPMGLTPARRGSARCRSRGAMWSGCARSSGFSAGCATPPPRRARSARWRIAAFSATRSPGSRFTATRPISSSIGRRCSRAEHRPKRRDRVSKESRLRSGGDGGEDAAADHYTTRDTADLDRSGGSTRRLLRSSCTVWRA